MTTTFVAPSVLSDDNTSADQRHVRRLEARARRAARRVGLVARKSRWRSPSNYAGFGIFDPSTNFPVYGWDYDLCAEDVIEYCTADE